MRCTKMANKWLHGLFVYNEVYEDGEQMATWTVCVE